MRRNRNCLTHALDGAKGYAIELLLKGFGPTGENPGVKTQRSNCFPKEGGLLVLRLSENHGDFRTAEGDRDAGESSAAAQIKQRVKAWGQSLRCGYGLEEMASQDLPGIADRGQVHAGVPAEDQGEISGELVENRRRKGLEAGI